MEQVAPRGYRSCCQVRSARAFRIGYAAQGTGRTYLDTVTGSLQLAAKAAGLDLVSLDNKSSRSVALHNADLFIRAKVDLVIEFQVADDIAASLSEKFTRAGIPMIAVDVPHPGAVYLGPNSYRAGLMAGGHLGGWAAKSWNGQVDQIILLDSAVSGPAVAARLRGMLDGIKQALPAAAIARLFRYDSSGRYDIALEAVSKHLRRGITQRVLVGALNDTSALGALHAFRDLGAEEHCGIAGQDGIADARLELRNPGSRLICTVAYFPESYGDRLVHLAMDMLQNQPVPGAVFTHHRLLTSATVEGVYPNDGWLAPGGTSAPTIRWTKTLSRV